MYKKRKNIHQPIQTAILGFGLSGRVFHAPFVNTNEKFRLHSIVSSGNKARKFYPETEIAKDFQIILDNPEIELIVICTPHHLHTTQACQALEAGKHVVIEKPVAMSSAEIEQIITAVAESGKTAFPYHNRRWDGDFMTVRYLIEQGFLGEVMDFESRFDRYSPEVLRAEWRYNSENGGGTLFDLAPHLVDQAICLFGKPESVWCQFRNQRAGSKANDSFDMKLIYPKLTASLRAGVFVKEQGPRFQVHGSKGSFVKYGLDPQEAALKKGKMPDSKNFGVDLKTYHGILHSEINGKIIRGKYATEPGYYMGFYEDVCATLTENKSPEVTLDDALLNIKIMEAAVKSNVEKQNINL
jgi:scyllo-inositol 2-dehydrogenase (NADP+)